MISPAGANGLESLIVAEPSIEDKNTFIIRGTAAHYIESEPDLVLTEVPDDYVHPIFDVYTPPSPFRGSGFIRRGLEERFKQDSYTELRKTLVTSPAFQKAIFMARGGRKLAVLGTHRKVTDTAQLHGAVQDAAEMLEPGNAAMAKWLNQRSRMIFGVMMPEMAYVNGNRTVPITKGLELLGGYYKVVPVTQATKRGIEEGLDPTLSNQVNFEVLKLWNRHTRSLKTVEVTLSPSGIVDITQAGENGQEEWVLGRPSPATGRFIRDFNWLGVAMNPATGKFAVSDLIKPGEICMDDFMANVLVPMCTNLDPKSGIIARYADPEEAQEPKQSKELV